jgi:hypothetical protein
MLFNDATAIKTEGKAKRKAIHDATLAEQMEKWRNAELLDEAEIAKCSWSQNMTNAEWKRFDKQVKEEMRNEADEDWQHIERERKRRNRERMEAYEADEDWQSIERDRPSGNKPSGSGCGNRLDKTLPHWIACNICMGTEYKLPIHMQQGTEYMARHRFICSICQARNPTLHGHILMPIIKSPKTKKEEEDAIMTSIEAMDKAKFYCAQCELDLNGAEDYAKHMAGKYHKNRVPNLSIPNIAMDLMHVMDNGIGSMLSSSSSSSK